MSYLKPQANFASLYSAFLAENLYNLNVLTVTKIICLLKTKPNGNAFLRFQYE